MDIHFRCDQEMNGRSVIFHLTNVSKGEIRDERRIKNITQKPLPEIHCTEHMAVYRVLSRKTLAGFAAEYGLGRLAKFSGVPAGSVNTHYLLVTTKGKFFLKIDEVKQPQEVQRELELLLFLRAQHFVCPRPLADQKGKYLSEYEGKMVSIYPYLAGESLSEKALSLGHLEKIGQTLATLHLLGQTYRKNIENRFRFERIAELYQEVKAQLSPHFRHLTHTLDEELEHQSQYAEEHLPKGIIHGDLFADNILFRGGKVAAVLDFEAAGYGKFIYDLATAINALCFIDGKYLIERFDTLLCGYQSVRTLTLGEWDAFPNELRFSAFRFTLTRLKDFFLHPMNSQQRINKDFRDFFDRLQVLRRERAGGMDRLLLAMATGYDYRQYQKIRIQNQSPEERTPSRKRKNPGRWTTTPSGITAKSLLQIA